MPARAMAASFAARPAVKLRLTGILPESSDAEIGDGRAEAGGQNDADALFRDVFAEPERDGDADGEEFAAGERAITGVGVGDDGGEEPFAQTAQAFVADMGEQFGPRLKGVLG